MQNIDNIFASCITSIRLLPYTIQIDFNVIRRNPSNQLFPNKNKFYHFDKRLNFSFSTVLLYGKKIKWSRLLPILKKFPILTLDNIFD
jgi:hypothetical protein